MPRHIYFFTVCNSMSAEMIIRQLLELDRQSNEEITMFINSPGGAVKDFFAIYNTMSMIKSPVKTVVLGQAASCAAILAACGKPRLISEDSEFMLHEVWSFFIGTTTQVEQKSQQMNNMQNRLMEILVSNTGKTAEQINRAMKNGDRYFNAKQAVQFGLADEIIKPDSNRILKLSENIISEGHELTYNDGSPEVELLCEGKYVHPVFGELLITEESLRQMKDNFDRGVRGIDISIDYTHENDNGEKPAAFWVKQLSVVKNSEGKSVLRIDKAEFTPAGKKKVEDKEFKYVSADFVMNYRDERGKNHSFVLCGGTLTNRPFIKELNPIKLSESITPTKENNQMDKQAMIAALKQDHGIDVNALTTEVGTLKQQISGLQDQIKQLKEMPSQKDDEIKALKDQIDGLNDQIVNTEKEQAFNELLSEGKVTTAQKEKVMKNFDTGESMKEFYTDAPNVIKKDKLGGEGDGLAEDLTPDEQAVVDSGELTKDEVIANRTVDSSHKAKREKEAAAGK